MSSSNTKICVAHKSPSKSRPQEKQSPSNKFVSTLPSIEDIRDERQPIRNIQDFIVDDGLPQTITSEVIHDDYPKPPESIEVPAKELLFVSNRITDNDNSINSSASDEDEEFCVLRPVRSYKGPERWGRYTLVSPKKNLQTSVSDPWYLLPSGEAIENWEKNFAEDAKKLCEKLQRQKITMRYMESEKNVKEDNIDANNKRRKAKRGKKKEQSLELSQTIQWNDMLADNGGYITITPEDDIFNPNFETNQIEDEICAEELRRKEARQERCKRKRRNIEEISTESSLLVDQAGDHPSKKKNNRIESSIPIVRSNVILTESQMVKFLNINKAN